MGQSASATVPRRGWEPRAGRWPRPRLLLYVAESDCPILVLRCAIGKRASSAQHW